MNPCTFMLPKGGICGAPSEPGFLLCKEHISREHSPLRHRAVNHQALAADLIEEFGINLDVPRDWRRDAACTGIDVEVFYPDKGGAYGPYADYCGSCPVRSACLAEATRRNEHWGIWGGLGEKERRVVRKEFMAMKQRRAA